ncbi:alpha/beta fold hydrolase [Cellulomonas sp. SLBN-39]|uniref:alpha/beta fold hydrolase n=1 Tax=Cellulomonas sp. SLBN-39 TaxID=2768446 RepID=UPI0011508999|nr:alpha/beta fold hydrolase [Cellulomonas sp. SLBN-39]TQL02128.1 alpha-beta hydrolase superfamily lysophospholipase [Cellulomonas sp. SLBN-39]
MTSSLTTTTVDAADGTALALHSVGTGPDVVVVHGAMQSGRSQRDLAVLLADRFRVHLLDRRGRGASGPLPVPPTQDLAVADLRAVLDATGADRVVGISSGALIAARAALEDERITRLVLFEPPLPVDGSMRLDLADELVAAVARGDLARAAAIGMKVAEMGPPWMFGLPLPVLALASRAMLRSPERRRMVEALPEDFAVVAANADRADDLAAIRASTLLVDGTATRPYLRLAVATLAATIPGATHVELPGQWHSATQNSDEYGHPELVAPVLASFLTQGAGART